jgi:hypothetical protein
MLAFTTAENARDRAQRLRALAARNSHGNMHTTRANKRHGPKFGKIVLFLEKQLLPHWSTSQPLSPADLKQTWKIATLSQFTILCNAKYKKLINVDAETCMGGGRNLHAGVNSDLWVEQRDLGYDTTPM